MLSFSEMLKGKQHKLDKNKNGKVDSHDFKLLRKEEQELEEASKSGEGKVETKKYSWGTMKTVHHGSEFSVPLHPEHHQAIAKLKDNQEHKFKDETGRHWTAKRMGDKVHIHGANDGGKTVVNHSDLKEEVELDEATPNKQQVKQAIGIARDKRYAGGNMTGAVKAMDKVNKGLAQHPAVKKELQKQNEELDEVAKATGDLKDACWKGYTAVGMKMKNGKKVPNCVPVKEEEETDIEEQAPAAPTLVKHRISVTVSDPNHTMVSKRNEKIQKTVIVTHSDNKEGAQKVGEKFYKKKGYRVHDSSHAGMVKEEVEEGMQQTLRKYVPGYAKHQLNKKMDVQAYEKGDSIKKTVDKDVNYARYKKIADKLNKEEVELDEERINGREYASQGVMHPDHAKMDIHKVSNQHVDFYASKTGDKMQGKVVKNDGKSVHIQAHKELGDGKLHKFKVQRGLPKPTNEEVDLEEKMDMSKADMGAVIKDFKKSDAPQFAGKSMEKRRQMAIAAKLQADRMKKEGVEMKSYKQFMEELVDKLLEDQVEVTEEAVDEGLDMKLLKSMQKDAKPRPKTSSDAIDPKTGKLKPYGYRGKSEYEKSETGDDEEPQKRGRKAGVSVGTYKRR